MRLTGAAQRPDGGLDDPASLPGTRFGTGSLSTSDPCKIEEARQSWNLCVTVAKHGEKLRRQGEGFAVEGDLLNRIAPLIHTPPVSNAKSTRSAKQIGLARALDYLHVAHAPSITVHKLAQVADVSPRTLELAFRDMFDLTPTGFLRLMRMHKARRDLAASDSDSTKVGAIADRSGFRQHGRFAVEYRRLFGESPSETLRRPSGGEA